ncbi:hypothetical protein NJT12_04855 [Flavobacterium sp. AC]|uniref:Uncharacterized protein n=1 Tax=Flavobacterium azizsancarii TaxID=2961580 RepID=A0ABT4W8R1_9FLAO|nr:hypothetical protein [Flavobacterium azizsancarii]MDA6068946.1 hypothetical protein [Flavobacterium azizsancarii]
MLNLTVEGFNYTTDTLISSYKNENIIINIIHEKLAGTDIILYLSSK